MEFVSTSDIINVPDGHISFQVGRYQKLKDGPVGRAQSVLTSPSNSEKSPEYRRTITYLNADTRIVLCKDGLQWILQRRRGREWKGFWYARSKAGLERGVLKAGAIETAAAIAIESLPDWAEAHLNYARGE